MYYSKKNMESIPEQETPVWICSKENCSCWMRENLSFMKNPNCPICNSAMVKNTKMLPPLSNYNNR